MSKPGHSELPSISSDRSPSSPCSLPAQPVSAHEAVRRSMHDRVKLSQLPPPPASATEWRERAICVCDGMPGLRAEFGNIPVGWFSLVEHAVLEMRGRLLPGQSFRTTQMKEKYGTLRWYGHVEDSTDERNVDTGAEGAIEWAECASATVCSIFGTPDGQIDRTGGWLLTLSARAASMRREIEATGVRSSFAACLYPSWDD